MNLPKLHFIIEEYVHSPFFYWFIFLLITEIGIGHPTIYEIREIIWSKQVWIPVLVSILAITYFIKIPVNSLLKSFPHLTTRTPLLHRTIMGSTLAVMLIVDGIFFVIGIKSILGINHPEIIGSKHQFEQSHIEGMIMEAVIPLVNYFCFIPTKNAIRKQLSIGNFYDKCKEVSFAFPFIWMFFIISMIVIVITNK